MADPARVAELVEVLGAQLDASEAAALLLAADGNVELAVTTFFSTQELGPTSLGLPSDEAGPSNQVLSTMQSSSPLNTADRPGLSQETSDRYASQRKLEEKLALLRELVGPRVGNPSLRKQLKKAKGCVNAAANAHFARVQASQKLKEKKASSGQRGSAMSCTTIETVAAESTGGAEVGASTTGHKRAFSLSYDPKEESIASRLGGRKRGRLYGDPKPIPIQETINVIRFEEFAYHSQSGEKYMLPLKKYRTWDGRFCAPLPETGFPDVVTPPEELDFSGPGLHLGSLTLSGDFSEEDATGWEDAFLDISWDSGNEETAGFQVGVTFEVPDGNFSINKYFAASLEQCREERDSTGISERNEEALRKLHLQDFVRLFITMDSCAEPVSNWKAQQMAKSGKPMDGTDVRGVREDLANQPAGLTPLQESAGQKAFNLHVCLTEKAFKFDAETMSNTGLAKHARAFGKNRTGDKALADVTEALLKHGAGLKLGPDSDALLNQKPGEAAKLGDSETLPADWPGILDSIGLPNSALVADCPRGLLTEPKRYQLQGLAWMLAREGADKTKEETVENELFLHPCWQQLLTADGQVMYMQRERGTCSPNFYVAPSQGTCGGLLCDEMGLGKTLEVLMLALAHPPPEGWTESDGQSGLPGASSVPIKATLVVVPASLLDQWKEEAARHVVPQRLKLLHYRGIKGEVSRKLEEKEERPSWDFEKYDIIVTSYEVVRHEMDGFQPTPLRQYGFWRLVLDEAQVVANSASLGARTVANIERRHAWVVTGTPITSRLKELESLLDFLGEPFGDPMVFRTMLTSPFEAQEERGLQRMQALLRTIMLRRTKEGVAHELELPPCTIEDRLLIFSPPEASFYRRMHDDFATALRRLDRLEIGRKKRDERLLDGFDAKNLSAKVSGNALAALNRLRQACCHPQIVKDGGVSLGRARLSMPQIMGRLADRASVDSILAAKDWLAAQVALAKERVNTRKENAADVFEPLLVDVAAYAALAAEVSASGSEGSPEWERKGQCTAMKNIYCRLELSALQAYRKAIAKMASGDHDESRMRSLQTRIIKLEDELGNTAANLARLANGRDLREAATDSDAKKKKKKLVKSSEQRLMEAEVEVQRAKQGMESAQGQENHLKSKLQRTNKGKEKAVDDADVAPQPLDGAADVIQEDKSVCPICLDSCQDCGAVTVCGHVFCGDCIRALIDRGGASGAPCPLCRHPLHHKDLFNVAEEEGAPDFSGEYGTKISAVLAELSALREADPRAKSVIFSSWRPLLALLGEALKEGNFRFSTLWGPEELRAQALSEFADDPDVQILLVTMGLTKGAAGLNLTAASTVFILEPSFHPGLEAQAASRIHRLGQLQPTHVIRFLVDATIEPKIAALAASRLARGKHEGKQSIVMELRGADLLQLVEIRAPSGWQS